MSGVLHGVVASLKAATDAFFRYVTLLLNTSATNGAQNNTFLDSSTNNFSITRNGDTTQGSFNPYMPSGYWSGFFDGTGDTLSLASNAAFNLASSNFTLEAWIYQTSGTIGSIINRRPAVSATGWGFAAGDFSATIGGTWRQSVITATVPNNVWLHVALVRNSNTFTLYHNGTSVGTYTQTGAVQDLTQAVVVGAVGGTTELLFTGYIANARMVVGTAVYTANFTPPTTPLTAITNTSLLCLQDNRFIDNSTNAFAITVNGDTRISKFAPLNIPQPYAPVAYGWSGYFDGTGDYLSVPDNAAWDFGTGDFTIEAWYYPTTSNAQQIIVGQWDGVGGGSGLAWVLFTSNNSSRFLRAATSSNGSTVLFDLVSTSALDLNAWNHVAFVRSGTTFQLYLNGAAAGSGSTTSSSALANATNALTIGASSGGTQLATGYISNVRIVKGTAVYTANFIPPAAPLTAITNTSLLTCQSSTFVDNSTNNFTITVNGNTVTRAVSPFDPYNAVGYYSGYFDGNGDELTLANNAAFEIGNGDFSYEAWVFATRQTNTFVQGIISYGVAGATGSATCSFQLDPSGYLALAYATGAANTIVDTTLFPINQWVHAVACRSGSTLSLFVNGTRVATATTSATVGAGGTMTIGGQWFANASTRQLQGYISNARVLKGSSAYNAASSTITVPTTPLTAITNTSLLACQDNRFVDNSINKFAITVNGNSTPRTFQPFSNYVLKAYPGTAYFDGTGDSLVPPQSSVFNLSTGDWTIEAWFYSQSLNSGGARYIVVTPSSGNIYGLIPSGASNAFAINQFGTGNVLASVVSPTLNSWQHIALVKSGSTTAIYLNGVSIASGTVSWVNANTTIFFGSNTGSFADNYTGYISNARVVVGTAVYTSAFTPPISPVTAITNTSLLLNFTNAGIFDAATINNGQTVGNAQVSTTQAKWSPTSMSFDGTGDYVAVIDKPELRIGTGDFTIEGWVYLTATGVAYGLVSKGTATTGWSVNVTSGNKLQFSYTATQLTGATSLASGTWYYFAVVRSGTASGNLRVILDGATDATSAGAVNDNFNQTNVLYVGADRVAGAVLNGYLQDVRITNGYARTTSTPTSAFPTL